MSETLQEDVISESLQEELRRHCDALKDELVQQRQVLQAATFEWNERNKDSNRTLDAAIRQMIHISRRFDTSWGALGYKLNALELAVSSGAPTFAQGYKSPDGYAASFVSFAGNYEDVVLWRALRNVGGNGFYIDVGANDGSTTKAFYDRGWRGINIEPRSECYARILSQRTRDLNLNVAVGDRTGSHKLRLVNASSRSTLDIANVRQLRQEEQIIESVSVPLLTLSDIFSEVRKGEVHFLKINVGGAEEAVVRGAEFNYCRPWIIVVASLASKPEWQGILTDAGYEHVLFDGRNVFFVAKEHPELKDILRAPANTSDDFASGRLVLVINDLQEKIQKLEYELLDGQPSALAEARRFASERQDEVRRLTDRLSLTAAALAKEEQLATDRNYEIKCLLAQLERTEAAHLFAQKLAIERQERLDSTDAALAETQKLAIDRYHELQTMQAALNNLQGTIDRTDFGVPRAAE